MKLTFTHDDLLILRWCVFDAKDSLPADQRKFLLMKLDKMLAEDDEHLEITKFIPAASSLYQSERISIRAMR